MENIINSLLHLKELFNFPIVRLLQVVFETFFFSHYISSLFVMTLPVFVGILSANPIKVKTKIMFWTRTTSSTPTTRSCKCSVHFKSFPCQYPVLFAGRHSLWINNNLKNERKPHLPKIYAAQEEDFAFLFMFLKQPENCKWWSEPP